MKHDTFDVAIALYHFLQHNWEGQTDPLYSDFCKLTRIFKVSHSEQFYGNISEAAKMIYEELTVQNYTEYLNQVINYNPESDYE